MTREIKFRAWDKEKKQFCFEGKFAITLDGRFINIWNEIEGNRDRFEIMQFTGLRDKNGEEIYEGDILNIELTDYFREKGVVEFEKGRFLIKRGEEFPLVLGNDFKSKHCRVLGNVYENTEFLKQRRI